MSFKPVSEYLPHTFPMILLDEIIRIEKECITCAATVSADGILSPFLDDNQRFPAYFFIEMMAQSIGIWNGFHNEKYQNTPKIAFLLGSRLFESKIETVPLHTKIEIEAKLILKDNNLANFEAYTIIRNKRVAHAKLNVYQPSQAEIETQLRESTVKDGTKSISHRSQ